MITRHELRFGAALGADDGRLWQRIEREVLPLVTWLAVTPRVSVLAGDVAAAQRRAGRPAGAVDPLIAATALAQGCALATRNVEHFGGVEGLVVEDGPPRRDAAAWPTLSVDYYIGLPDRDRQRGGGMRSHPEPGSGGVAAAGVGQP